MSGWERSLPFLIIALRPYVDATAGLIQTPDSRRLSNGEATDNQAAASRRRTVVIQASSAARLYRATAPTGCANKENVLPSAREQFPREREMLPVIRVPARAERRMSRAPGRMTRLIPRGTSDALSPATGLALGGRKKERRHQWPECQSQVSGRRCRHDSASNVHARSCHHGPNGSARARAWRRWWWWRRWRRRSRCGSRRWRWAW